MIHIRLQERFGSGILPMRISMEAFGGARMKLEVMSNISCIGLGSTLSRRELVTSRSEVCAEVALLVHLKLFSTEPNC
jgi:hypothetical protein